MALKISMHKQTCDVQKQNTCTDNILPKINPINMMHYIYQEIDAILYFHTLLLSEKSYSYATTITRINVNDTCTQYAVLC